MQALHKLLHAVAPAVFLEPVLLRCIFQGKGSYSSVWEKSRRDVLSIAAVLLAGGAAWSLLA